MKETNEQMYSEAEQPVREVGPSTVCNSGVGWGRVVIHLYCTKTMSFTNMVWIYKGL